MTAERIRRYREGLWAETLCVLYLRLKGYRIHARRFRTGQGEIDVIAGKGGVVAFVEVKRRRSRDDALSAVGPKAQARIARAAMAYIGRNPHLAGRDFRFDVVAVSPPFGLLHLDNAWTPPS